MEAIKKLDPYLDPLGFDIFESVETYDSLMGTLAATYYHLFYREREKPEGIQNKDKMEEYHKRQREIRQLKRIYPSGAVLDRNKAIELYSKELKKAKKLLENEIGSN